MGPDLASKYTADCGLLHAEPRREVNLSLGVTDASDLANLFVSERSFGVLLASGDGVCKRKVLPSLLNHVGGVLLVRTHPQMRGVAAEPSVAGMADALARGDVALEQSVDQRVDSKGPFAISVFAGDVAVTSGALGPFPNPALVGRPNFNVGPQGFSNDSQLDIHTGYGSWISNADQGVV